ncbi:hypothetical protein BJP26_18590 [Sphingomonas melonis TY]|nr:hypothetical protein BJP26_18590 [Sphingomonas melonis TY]
MAHRGECDRIRFPCHASRSPVRGGFRAAAITVYDPAEVVAEAVWMGRVQSDRLRQRIGAARLQQQRRDGHGASGTGWRDDPDVLEQAFATQVVQDLACMRSYSGDCGHAVASQRSGCDQSGLEPPARIGICGGDRYEKRWAAGVVENEV